MKSNVLPITMSSSTFSDLKRDMTIMLQGALAKMEEVGSDTGNVSAVINITIDKTPVTGEREYRSAKVPKFKHKVTYNVPLKNDMGGEFGGEYELISEDGQVSLRPINGQTSMFEAEEDDEEEAEGE